MPDWLYPLSFAEFYSVYDGDYDDAWDDYMTYGGLPQIVSFQSERQKADYLKNIFANVLRAADCKPFVQKGRCPFWTVSKGPPPAAEVLLL